MKTLIFIALLTTSPCCATTQILFGSTGAGNFTANANSFQSLLQQNVGGNASVSNVGSLMPTGGTLHDFCFKLEASAGSGTYSMQTQVNGSASGPIVSAVSATTLTCDRTNAVHVNQGQIVTYITTVSTSPNPTAVPGAWSIAFTPDIPNQTIYFGGAPAVSASTFNSPAGYQVNTGTETSAYQPWPMAGTFENLCINATTSPGGGASWTVNLDSSSVATSLTKNVTTTTYGCDSTHQPTVAAGAEIDFSIVANSSPASSVVFVSVVFVPNVIGQFAILNSRTTGLTANSTVYATPGARTAGATEQVGIQIPTSLGFTAQALYIYQTGLPGASQTWTFRLRDNGATQAGLTVTVTNSSTFPMSVTSSFASANGDLLDTLITGTATATVPTATAISYLAFIPQPIGRMF